MRRRCGCCADRQSSPPVRSWPFPVKELFAGHGVEEFFRESLKMHRTLSKRCIISRRESRSCRRDDGARLSGVVDVLHRRPYLPSNSPVSTRCSTSSCSTNGISTSSMTSSSSARKAARLLSSGRRAMASSSTALARMAFRPCARRHPQRGENPDRLSLSLCLCDADRVAGLITCSCSAWGPVMDNWPILSVVTFLPVIGAIAIYLNPAATTRRAAQCALDRAVDHAGSRLRCR